MATKRSTAPVVSETGQRLRQTQAEYTAARPSSGPGVKPMMSSSKMYVCRRCQANFKTGDGKPRRPVEEQLAQLTDEDRKALARLGVRIGVFSLYFPSMLKPVPIRLRAGLWMIAKNRAAIPTLPAEGRTSMDLPRDAVISDLSVRPGPRA